MPKPAADRLQNTLDLLTGLPSDEEIDAEVARLETLGARERARELEEAGFSPSEVAASARHLRERADEGSASSSFGAEHELRTREREPPRPGWRAVQAVPAIAPEAPREAPRRFFRFATAFLVAAVLALVAVELTAHRPKEPFIAQPSPSSSASPSVLEPTAAPSPPSREPAAHASAARELRARAALACHASSWHECGDMLDRAATIDPQGDRDPGVTRLRRDIAEGLGTPSGRKPQ
jgi:hypothetical protein